MVSMNESGPSPRKWRAVAHVDARCAAPCHPCGLVAKSDFENGSFTEEGRAKTRENLERLLDHYAIVGVERDNEPPDEPTTEAPDGRGGMRKVVQPIRRPLRAYIAARRRGISPSYAVLPTFHCHTAHPADRSITLARVKFDALAQALFRLDEDAPEAPTHVEPSEARTAESDPLLDEFRDCILMAREARAALARYRDAAEPVFRRNVNLIALSRGVVYSTIPSVQLHPVDRMLQNLTQVERELGVAGAQGSPDFANLIRGRGRWSRYSLGRVLVSLSQGVVGHEAPGEACRAERAYRAFTLEQRMEIVFDRLGPEDDGGRFKRYDNAEKRYREMYMDHTGSTPELETE